MTFRWSANRWANVVLPDEDGPGNQHDFLVLDGNIRRNVGNRLVVQRFIQADEVAEAVSLHHLRDVGSVVDAQQRAPPRRLVKHCQMPRAMHIRRGFLRVIGCRQTQNDAAVGSQVSSKTCVMPVRVAIAP